MSKLPVTILIPTLNAEAHLAELLDSIGDSVQDIQILDSRSNDRTIDIALERGISVVQRAFTSFGDHFQWMVSNLPVRTEWIFLMAQDERFTPSLISSLQELLSQPNHLNGYSIRWRLWFMNKPLHIIIDNLRLMRVGQFRIADVTCNEQILVDGPTGKLSGILEHKDTITLHEWYEKQNLYSTLEAISYATKKGQFSVAPRLLGGRMARRMFIKKIFFLLPFRHQLTMLYNLIYMGAWRDGPVGIIWARLRSDVYRMYEYKVIEMRRTGFIPQFPEARHGDFDPRIIASELQQRLLPEVCRSWQDRSK